MAYTASCDGFKLKNTSIKGFGLAGIPTERVASCGGFCLKAFFVCDEHPLVSVAYAEVVLDRRPLTPRTDASNVSGKRAKASLVRGCSR